MRTKIDYSEHFCNGQKDWKNICFECKYPKDKRVKMLLKELRKSQIEKSLHKGLKEQYIKLFRKLRKEREFYKNALKKAIEDIEWSKTNKISKLELIREIREIFAKRSETE